MDNKNLGTKVTKGLFWFLCEKVLVNLVGFIVSIILARLLLPEDYGLIALITIIINISNVFVDSGFGTALIQKKNADDLDFQTVFWTEIVVSFLLYFILFFFAPLIAEFYDERMLIPVLRVYGIFIILGSIKNVQHAFVSKQMKFRLFFFATLGGTIVSAIIGILMAFWGFGVWALIAQVLINCAMDSIILFIKIEWKPKFCFSFQRLKGLFSFGWKLLATSLLSTIYNNLYGLIIGKVYNTTVLALYNKGNSFPTLISNNVTGPIQQATFPALAIVQDDKQRLKSMTRKTIQTTTYVLWPLLVGMAAVASPMISILLTDKWLDCVIFLQINVVATLFWPISSANGQLINAVGKSGLSLKLDIIKKTFGIVILVITIPFGIVPMAWGRALGQLIAMICDTLPNKKIIDYGFWEQIKDLIPNTIVNAALFFVVYLLSFLQINVFIKLLIQIISGIIIYIILSKIFNLEGLNYVWLQMCKILKKNNG